MSDIKVRYFNCFFFRRNYKLLCSLMKQHCSVRDYLETGLFFFLAYQTGFSNDLPVLETQGGVG